MGKLCGINVAQATPSATSFYQKIRAWNKARACKKVSIYWEP